MFLPFISTRYREAARHCWPAWPPARSVIRSAHRLADFQHGGRLHDFFHTRRIVDAGQLHKDLVVAESVLLDDRLVDAELIDAVANGLDGLGDGAILQVSRGPKAS